MATESRVPPPDLTPEAWEEDLTEAPETFSFFQAVRLLHRHLQDRSAVGYFAAPSEEVARFSVNPSLAFPAGDIQDLREDSEGRQEMVVNFMGLVGHMGVLPMQYTLLVDDQAASEGDPDAFRQFLDIFQHRILSLFYRAWERSHFYVPFERGDDDPLSRRLLDLIGLGSGDLRSRMRIRDEALLFYSGLLGANHRNAIALERFLEDYFDAPVDVVQFKGGWFGLSPESQCRIDDEEEGMGGLGEGTVVGDEIWDPQARVRLRIGPLRREAYDDFLPGGRSHEDLKGITQFFGDGQFDFEVQLILHRDDVPGIVLGAEEDEAPPLGWCSWIRSRPFTRDADETTFLI
jgi:type VI secretion system protein ImpH